jgi:hypothetical protein
MGLTLPFTIVLVFHFLTDNSSTIVFSRHKETPSFWAIGELHEATSSEKTDLNMRFQCSVCTEGGKIFGSNSYLLLMSQGCPKDMGARMSPEKSQVLPGEMSQVSLLPGRHCQQESESIGFVRTSVRHEETHGGFCNLTVNLTVGQPDGVSCRTPVPRSWEVSDSLVPMTLTLLCWSATFIPVHR